MQENRCGSSQKYSCECGTTRPVDRKNISGTCQDDSNDRQKFKSKASTCTRNEVHTMGRCQGREESRPNSASNHTPGDQGRAHGGDNFCGRCRNHDQQQKNEADRANRAEQLLEKQRQNAAPCPACECDAKKRGEGQQDTKRARSAAMFRYPRSCQRGSGKKKGRKSKSQKMTCKLAPEPPPPPPPTRSHVHLGDNISLDLSGYGSLVLFYQGELFLEPDEPPLGNPPLSESPCPPEPATEPACPEVIPYPDDWPWYWSRFFPNGACKVARKEHRWKLMQEAAKLAKAQPKPPVTTIYCTTG